MPSILRHRFTPISFFARLTVVSFLSTEFNSPKVRNVSESGFESTFGFFVSFDFFSRFFFSVDEAKTSLFLACISNLDFEANS